MNKSVLHIFGGMNRGGAELRTIDTIEPLKERGIKLSFCALSGQEGVLDQQLKEKGNEVFYCKLGLAFPFRFYRLLKQQHFDCVHSHVAYVSGFILFIAWLAGVKNRIAHFRSTQDSNISSPLRTIRNKTLKLLIRLFATKVLGVCNAALDAFWSKDWQKDPKCQVIYNGFTLNSNEKNNQKFWCHLGLQQKLPVIINVARMDPPKNHEFIIDVFIKTYAQHPCYLVLIGKENQLQKQQLIKKLQHENLVDYVHFAGEQANVYPFLVNANAMLFPSKWEGLPGAVIEAASVGLPIVASRLPGVEEIAQYLPCVKTCDLLDNNERWSKALISALSDNDRVLAKKAFSSSPFNLIQCVESLYAIYQ